MAQPIQAPGDVPQTIGITDACDGIHVKTHDVGPLNVTVVVFGLAASPSGPIITNKSLAEIEKNRTRGIVCAHLIVQVDDRVRRYGRPVASTRLRLSVVGFVLVHPGDNDWIIYVLQSDLILF